MAGGEIGVVVYNADTILANKCEFFREMRIFANQTKMGMYYRRKVLLAVIEVFGGFLSAKQVQKLLFLFCRQQDVKSYDFVPYHYGCYSFQASQDLHTLGTLGYLRITDTSQGKHIKLLSPENFVSSLTLFDQVALENTRQSFGNMSQDELIRYTYVHFPYFATKSDIAENILTPQELERVRAQESHFPNSTLFTIGYEGISLEKYINILLTNDVRVLCDVRKNAFSQKFGFSKSQLREACEGVGIEYIHIPQLGIESDQRQSLKTQDDYDHLFAQYESTTLLQNMAYVLDLRKILDDKKRIALTCFEASPKQCHRSRVADALMRLDNVSYSRKDLQNA